MILGLTLALGGATMMSASPIERTVRRRRFDRSTLEGVGTSLVTAFADSAQVPADFADLLGRLSDPEPAAPLYPSTPDV